MTYSRSRALTRASALDLSTFLIAFAFTIDSRTSSTARPSRKPGGKRRLGSLGGLGAFSPAERRSWIRADAGP